MKAILLLASIFSLAAATHFIESAAPVKIMGTVISESGTPLEGAEVYVHETKRGSMTDSTGYFEMMARSGAEKLSIHHYMYETAIVDITEAPLKVTLKERKSGALVGKQSNKAIRIRGASASDGYVRTPAVEMESMSYDSEGTLDEVVVTGMAMKSKKEMRATSMSPPKTAEPLSPRAETLREKAGQLTAGEWNDLNNWEAWNKLVKEADYKEMGQHWGLKAQERVSVFVMNQHELPIADCEVTLMSDGKIVWSAKTDNAGKAELWASEGQQNLKIEVRSRENRNTLSKVKKIKEGVNIISFTEECASPLKAEIMFVVDATGSMGDEIEFLKSELSDVIDQVESDRQEIDFRWGSVFYRDDSDHYLTRQSPLSEKPKRVLDFIKRQSAGGGGDYPEAVNEGLEEALMQDWSEDAIARIIFLVLDAPPHHDPEVLEDLESQIAFAAARGIKIIPITASGINRHTEYLMKFMSIMTNGTYVFLTDHSGIGGAHLDPITKDYEVEKLNDLLVRVIRNYTDPGTCVRQQDADPLFAAVEVFPNPTVDMLQVKVPEGISKITLTTSSGMLIHSESIAKQCDVSLDLTKYVDGMYVVNFYSEDEVFSVKVIKSGRV